MSIERRSGGFALVGAVWLTLVGPFAHAQSGSAPPGGTPPVYDVTVRERRPLTSGSQFVVDDEDFALRRLDRPDDVLERVPALLTAQHSGGGKANQYLLRGFDADHGTDVAFFIDGVPTNLRSHAHGQGYNDMNFVIPETIERIDVSMGPYSPEYGDFATAGAVTLRLWERAPESFVKATVGQWATVRTVGLWSPESGIFAGEDARATLLAAGEFVTGDGPFDHGEDLYAFKGLVRFGYEISDRTRLDAWASAYAADWDASGQIPRRLLGQDGFDRFDNVDRTQGGDTDRQIALARFVHEPGPGRHLEVTSWISHYALDLYSNFTFFLDEPERGDGIVQNDDRIYGGGTAVYRHALDWALPTVLTAGLDHRTDRADVALRRQQRRDRFEALSSARVRQTSLAGYGEADVLLLPWARFVGGLRAEGFWFDVRERDDTGEPDGQTDDAVVLPKANLILTPFAEEGVVPVAFQPLRDSSFYLNFGVGYHSNDARDAIANPSEPTIPRATGWELGWKTTLGTTAELSVAYWWLRLQREFVFVGDAGETELRPRSERQGVEAAVRVTPWSWLRWEGAISYSRAEFANGDNVPQAPELIAKSTLFAELPYGFAIELDYTALGPRDAEETGSVELHDYQVLDLALRYRRGPFEGILGIDNLTNTKWESSEFFYASRLPGEPEEGVADFHFTPGYPRNVRAGVTWYFD